MVFAHEQASLRRQEHENDPAATREALQEKGVAEFSRRRFAPFVRKSHSKAPRVLVLPPRFIPLAVRRLTVRLLSPPLATVSLTLFLSVSRILRFSPLLSCISTRNFPFFFIILFIFLANHSDPAAVCLSMQMQRVGASCSPVSSVSVSPPLASCTFYNTDHLLLSDSPCGLFLLLLLLPVSEYY